MDQSPTLSTSLDLTPEMCLAFSGSEVFKNYHVNANFLLSPWKSPNTEILILIPYTILPSVYWSEKNGPNAGLYKSLWILKGMICVSFVSGWDVNIRYVVVLTQAPYELGQASNEAVWAVSVLRFFLGRSGQVMHMQEVEFDLNSED